MVYTKESLKKMIKKVIDERSEMKVTNVFNGLYKKDKDFRKFIDDPQTTFGDTLAQRLFNIYYGIKEWPKCKYEKCKNLVKFTYFNKGYRETCSKYCTNYIRYGCKSVFKLKDQHEKAQNTLLKKTGFRSGAANPETRAKMVATMKERYGDVFQRTEEFKDKYKKTCVERYGAENYMSTEEGIKKSKESQKKKYNGLLYQQTKEFKEFATKQYFEKNKKEKTAKGQRDSFYKKLKKKAEKLGFDLLFTIDEYKSYFDENHNWRKYPFKCKSCGYEFEIALGNIHRDGINCPNCCKKIKSKVQHRLLEQIKSDYKDLTFIEDEYRILDNKKEIDIFCEEKNFGIEYNGNCWHAQKFNGKGESYHFDKFLQFEKHNVSVLSFWSDEFDKKSKFIYELISLFLNKNEHFDKMPLKYEFIDKVPSSILAEYKNRCFYEISAKDTFILVKSKNDDILAILKCKNSVVNEITHMKQYDFKSTFDFFNGALKFKLDNRLMPYYKLFFNEKVKFKGYEKPRFYVLNKKQRSMLKSNLAKVDFSKEDIIWNYGESFFELF